LVQEYFKNDTMAIIGYGSQGHAQSLNMRDNGLNVVVGVRKNGQSWKDAQQDGWVPGKNLFDVDEAISKGTIIMNLLSDAAQSETWPAIKPQITKGKASSNHLSSLNYTDLCRRFTSPTASLQFSRTRPRSMFLPMLMSSSSPLKDLDELYELFSARDVVSTPPLPFSRMSPARPRRRQLPSVLVLEVDTSTRPHLRRRSTPTYMVNVVA